MSGDAFAIGSVTAEYRANDEPLDRIIGEIDRRLTHELGGEEGINELVIVAVRGPLSSRKAQARIVEALRGGGD